MVEGIETGDVNARLARIRDGMECVSARMDGLYDEIRELNAALYGQDGPGDVDEALLAETMGEMRRTSAGGERRWPAEMEKMLLRAEQSYCLFNYRRHEGGGLDWE